MGIKIYCDECRSEIDLHEEKIKKVEELVRRGWDIDVKHQKYHICKKCSDFVKRVMGRKKKGVEQGEEDEFNESLERNAVVVETTERDERKVGGIDVIDSTMSERSEDRGTNKPVYMCGKDECKMWAEFSDDGLNSIRLHEKRIHGFEMDACVGYKCRYCNHFEYLDDYIGDGTKSDKAVYQKLMKIMRDHEKSHGNVKKVTTPRAQVYRKVYFR